jgi:hypothetical protein
MSETVIQSGDTAPDTTTTTDDPLPLVGENGAFRPDWNTTLGEGYEKLPDNMPKDLSTLAKGYLSSQDMITKLGKEKGDLKTQLDQNAPIGAPEVYTLSRKPDDVPEDMWNQEAIDTDIARLREGNFTDDQATLANTMFQEKLQSMKETQEQAGEQKIAQSIQSLRDKWGTHYDGNIVSALETAKKIGIDIDNEQVGNNAHLIEALQKISSSVGESVIRGAGPANTVGITGSENYLAQSAAIVQDPSNPMYEAYHSSGHQQHAEAHKKHAELLQAHVTKMQGR